MGARFDIPIQGGAMTISREPPGAISADRGRKKTGEALASPVRWFFQFERSDSSEGIDVTMAIDLIINVSGGFAQFFANDVHIARSLDTNSHGIGTDTNDRDRHVITNQDLLAWLSREHQHTATPFLVLKNHPCFLLSGLNVSPPQHLSMRPLAISVVNWSTMS